jgi:hypothetical protein
MSLRTRHTPGPWRVDRAHARPQESDPLAIYAPNGDRLAILTDESTDEWRANAQLMAAAPELLAEAEVALALIKQGGDDLARKTYFKSNVVMARLQAVIDKAKGETA